MQGPHRTSQTGRNAFASPRQASTTAPVRRLRTGTSAPLGLAPAQQLRTSLRTGSLPSISARHAPWAAHSRSARPVPLARLRRVPVARYRLEHAQAVALGIDE